MKLAITGGSGFLGYHIVHALAPKYSEILLLDIAPVDPREYPSNVRFVKTDITQASEVDEALASVDVVVHAAAALPLYTPRQIVKTNVEGTRHVLEAALKHRIKRVVHISSTAVYGVPLKHPIEESDPRVGVGPYGESKIEAEKLCEEFREKGLLVPILRPKTFIGTGRLGVFQILYDWVSSGKKIPVIGNGQNLYQLLEVTDLVRAIDLMLSAPESKVQDVFNVGAERFGRVVEDVGALCAYAKSGARVMRTPAGLIKGTLGFFEKLHLSPLYKWVYATADKDSFVSVEKIKQRVGWAARYSNAEALIRSYQWYLDHCADLTTGVTHRAAWKQGVLNLFKKIL